jgi:hypothetical protein
MHSSMHIQYVITCEVIHNNSACSYYRRATRRLRCAYLKRHTYTWKHRSCTRLLAFSTNTCTNNLAWMRKTKTRKASSFWHKDLNHPRLYSGTHVCMCSECLSTIYNNRAYVCRGHASGQQKDKFQLRLRANRLQTYG